MRVARIEGREPSGIGGQPSALALLNPDLDLHHQRDIILCACADRLDRHRADLHLRRRDGEVRQFVGPEIGIEFLIQFGEIAEHRARRIDLRSSGGDGGEIGFDLAASGGIERQIMGEQPAASVQRGPLVRVAQALAAEQDRQWHACPVRSSQGGRAVDGATAEPDRSVRVDVGSRHEFGKAFDQPRRDRRGEVRKHQMMGIFVKEHRLGRGRGIQRQLTRNDRHRPPVSRSVEPEHVAAGRGVQHAHVERARHDQHGQSTAVADRRILHRARDPHALVEPLELLGEGAQFVGCFVGVNDEMRRRCALPFGGRRGGERCQD